MRGLRLNGFVFRELSLRRLKCGTLLFRGLALADGAFLTKSRGGSGWRHPKAALQTDDTNIPA
jgi:hypothetical protein